MLDPKVVAAIGRHETSLHVDERIFYWKNETLANIKWSFPKVETLTVAFRGTKVEGDAPFPSPLPNLVSFFSALHAVEKIVLVADDGSPAWLLQPFSRAFFPELVRLHFEGFLPSTSSLTSMLFKHRETIRELRLINLPLEKTEAWQPTIDPVTILDQALYARLVPQRGATKGSKPFILPETILLEGGWVYLQRGGPPHNPTRNKKNECPEGAFPSPGQVPRARNSGVLPGSPTGLELYDHFREFYVVREGNPGNYVSPDEPSFELERLPDAHRQRVGDLLSLEQIDELEKGSNVEWES